MKDQNQYTYKEPIFNKRKLALQLLYRRARIRQTIRIVIASAVAIGVLASFYE